MITIVPLSTSSITEFIDITDIVCEAVRESGVREGLCNVFVPHTTAAVTINENADPSVIKDMIKRLDKMVPVDGGYQHAEGNSAAHIKSALIGVDRNVIIENGQLDLGKWQGIYFCEFDGPRQRKAFIKIIGK